MTDRKALAAAPDQPKEVVDGEWHDSLEEAQGADRRMIPVLQITIYIHLPGAIRAIGVPMEIRF